MNSLTVEVWIHRIGQLDLRVVCIPLLIISWLLQFIPIKNLFHRLLSFIYPISPTVFPRTSSALIIFAFPYLCQSLRFLTFDFDDLSILLSPELVIKIMEIFECYYNNCEVVEWSFDSGIYQNWISHFASDLMYRRWLSHAEYMLFLFDCLCQGTPSWVNDV